MLGLAASVVAGTIDGLMKQAHATATEHGWWDRPRSDGECLMLMVTELSEAMEGVRGTVDGTYPASEKIPGFNQVEEELADVLIRIFDFAEQHQLLLGEALLAKMEYNESRPYRHGGKAA